MRAEETDRSVRVALILSHVCAIETSLTVHREDLIYRPGMTAFTKIVIHYLLAAVKSVRR